MRLASKAAFLSAIAVLAATTGRTSAAARPAIGPDVSIAKTCPVDMIAGENAAYTLVVANSGTAVAKNVVVTDVLPDGVSFVSAVNARSVCSQKQVRGNQGRRCSHRAG